MRHPQSARWALVPVLFLTFLVSTTSAGPLPQDAKSLLPADPAAVLAVTSVNEMVDQIATVSGAFDVEGGGPEREKILEDIRKAFGGYAAVLDLDRPLIAAFGLPDMMGGIQPPVTLILPLRPGSSVPDTLRLKGFDVAATARRGNYLALSTYPEFVPADAVSDLAGHLPDGLFAISLNLEQVVLNFRPFIEMGLMGIPTRPADTPPDSTGAFSPEEAQVIGDVVRDLMDAATRLDLAAGMQSNMLTWTVGLGVKPGSVLDPGPQPDFGRALALTSALPADADIVQVLAFDQTRMFDAFRDYYLITMRQSMAALEPEVGERYSVWVQSYLESLDLWAAPMAAALSVRDDHMAVMAITEPADATAALDRLSALLDELNDVGIGFSLTSGDAVKVAGVDFRTWTIDFDLEQFQAILEAEGAMDAPGPANIPVEQMVGMLRKIMPKLYLGVCRGHLLIASDEDTEDLAHMVEVTEAGRLHATVGQVAASAHAGEGCRQLVNGDLMSFVSWMTDMVNELDPQEKMVVEKNPIPFQSDFTINASNFHFWLGIDLEAVAQLSRAMEAMEPGTTEGGD